MSKYKKQYEKWGYQELKAVINGKLTGVKYDKGADSYFVRIPQQSGKAIKKNLGRNKGRAAGKWWSIVEEHMQDQLQTLPTDQLQTRKVLRFRQQDHQTDEQFDRMVQAFVAIATKQEDETLEEWNERIYNNSNLEPFINNVETFIPEQALADIFNKRLEDPMECSKRLRREDIANLPKLQVAKPIPLRNMGEFYYNYIPTNRTQASQKERRTVRSFWGKFCDVVNKTYLNDLIKDDIMNYTQSIIRTAHQNNRSNCYIRKRFDAVRNVVNAYSKCLEDKLLTNTVGNWLRDFPAPQRSANGAQVFNPHHLTKEQFQEILQVTEGGIKWRAAVLFAINTCSYAVDCRYAKLENIDFSNNTLRMIRRKTTTAKVAILWDETVNAIQAYLDHRNSNSPFLFISQQRSMMSESAWTKGVREHIKQKLSFEFNFNYFRDCGRYAAENAGASPNHIKIAMGHRIAGGVDDAYLCRHPELVQDVSDGIYSYYMGELPTPSTPKALPGPEPLIDLISDRELDLD